jgi:hypothetical protein
MMGCGSNFTLISSKTEILFSPFLNLFWTPVNSFSGNGPSPPCHNSNRDGIPPLVLGLKLRRFNGSSQNKKAPAKAPWQARLPGV